LARELQNLRETLCLCGRKNTGFSAEIFFRFHILLQKTETVSGKKTWNRERTEQMNSQIFPEKEKISLPQPSRKGFVTNYPPFRQWKNTGEEEILSGSPINIYVHIPFCVQRCAYCYYKTNELKDKKEHVDRYVNAICREIELAASRFHLGQRPVESVYFGGGTPTLLKPEHLQKITQSLHTYLNIGTPEFTVEAEPVTLTQKKADLLKELGVNRISLGVQSFSDEILAICNRLDNEEKVLKAIDMAQGTGAVVNIDLLSGLAGETFETWKYSADRAISTGAESITVYKMELYANTDYYKSLRKKEIVLPSEEEELAFMTYAMEQFEKNQYVPWCFFTFTRNGQYKNIYASSLWQGTDCYAFGASGFGSMGRWLYQNTNDDEKYTEILESGKLPVNRGYLMTDLEEIIRRISLGMKLVRFDLKAFQNRFGFRLESLCSPVLETLAAEGFISVSDEFAALTSKGILYGDYSGKCVAEFLRERFF